MSEVVVPRYNLERISETDLDMLLIKNGDWILYYDYQELLDRYNKLRNAVLDAWKEIDD